MTQQILCITAGQRSGTTALRSLIASSGRFQDLGEIFDTSIIDQPESFFGYCRARKLQFTDVMSGPDAEKLCHDYLAMLQHKAGSRNLLFDVKFNSWGEIRMPWTFMHQEPFFLTQLKWKRAKLLFIWRRDIVGQVLSDRISDHIAKWHNLEKSDVDAPFELDVEKIRTRARLLCLSEKYFFHNLRTYPETLMLCYERLFDRAGLLEPQTRDKISVFLGEDLAVPKSSLYHKNRLEQSRTLTNYQQLASAISQVAAEHREHVLATQTEL
jgi:hypothetical protein